MGNSVPTLKLQYFPIAGRGEPIRLALGVQEIEFEDELVDFKTWGELKSSSKFGQMPLLTITEEGDTRVLSQMSAILRYVSTLKSKTLYPENPLERAKVDEVCGLLEDLNRDVSSAIYFNMKPQTYGHPENFHRTEEGKAILIQLRTRVATEILPKFCGFFTTLLEESNEQFLCGDSMTIADLMALPQLDRYRQGSLDHVPTDVLDAYPKVTAYLQRMKEHADVKGHYDRKQAAKEAAAQAAAAAEAEAKAEAAAKLEAAAKAAEAEVEPAGATPSEATETEAAPGADADTPATATEAAEASA
jgi:glutathione S-transferase